MKFSQYLIYNRLFRITYAQSSYYQNVAIFSLRNNCILETLLFALKKQQKKRGIFGGKKPRDFYYRTGDMDPQPLALIR